MGFWDAVNYTRDLVKGITPDTSTVKRAGAVRVDGIQKLPRYWPDNETRSQIGLFTFTLAKHAGKYAVYEGFKHIPGATVVSKLVSDTMREMNQARNQKGPRKQ